MNKLFISDLDGTLLTSGGEVSQRTKEIINALTKKGVCFSVATARTIMSARHLLSGLEINTPVILMNGVCIYDMAEGKYLSCNYISRDSVKRYIHIVSGKRDISPYIYTIRDDELTAYYENMDTEPARSFAEERKKRYGKSFVKCDFRQLDNGDAVYFTMCGKREVLAPYYEEISRDRELYVTFYRDTYDTSIYYLEACSGKASKAGGILKLKEMYGFREVYCFGDNTNDLPMFRASEHRYSVANGVQELKSEADEIIASNDEDGVALKIKELWG